MSTSPSSAWAAFCSLASSTSSTGKGLPCGADGKHFLVKGAGGEPILFLCSMARQHPRAPIRLRNVIGEFDRKYAYQLNEQAELAGVFTTLRCVPEAAHLHPFFVELAVATANAQPAALSEQQVDELVSNLIDLFSPGRGPKQSTVAGLWGELAVLSVADDPNSWVNAWHQETTDTFDFCFTDKRIEVKTTEKALREHEFSGEQITGATANDFVASVQLKRSAAGHTALELASEISLRLEEKSRAKFWALVYATLGEDSISADDFRYDLKLAQGSALLVPSSKLPQLQIPAQHAAFVSHIRYRVNIEPISREFGIKLSV